MKSLLIKVIWEGQEIVFRDLLAREDLSLLALHKAIPKVFGLDKNQMASFTQYDETLQIQTDYQLEAFDEDSSLMEEISLKEVFEKEGDALEYTYDFLKEIRFSLELIEINEKEKGEDIILVKSHGELPKDLGSDVDPEDAESILIRAMLDEAEEDEEEDEDDIFNQGGYESLDDYEEYL